MTICLTDVLKNYFASKSTVIEKKPGKYKIRIELIENTDIYDEIEIFIPNKFEKKGLKNIQTYEQLLDRGILGLQYRLGLIE